MRICNCIVTLYAKCAAFYHGVMIAKASQP